jgi:hypothetical protein
MIFVRMKQKNIKTNDVELMKQQITHLKNNVLQLEHNFRSYIYEGESVNRPQMDIKRRTCHIRIWGKHIFLNIFSTNYRFTNASIPAAEKSLTVVSATSAPVRA